MKEKTPWDLKLEKSQKNIGFVTRLGAFREPSAAEKAAALAIETQAWQDSKGSSSFRISAPYSVPLGHGRNLKDSSNYNERRNAAIKAYVETPMDPTGALKEIGVDVQEYKPKSLFQRFRSWVLRKTDPDWLPGRWSYFERSEYRKWIEKEREKLNETKIGK